MSLRSDQYDDIYFSPVDGAGESTFVYLEGNGFPGRFRQPHPGDSTDRFVIAELGFGAGLNFLLTAKAFLENAPSSSRLLYYSVEKHPLPFDQMKEALRPFEDLASFQRDLLALLRDSSWRLPGFHTLFFHPRIRLTILTGEAEEMLSSLDGGTVDAWYPDGFAPAKNPAMWSEGVFAQMARLSRPGTTLATYSSAGAVRRGLESAGFTIEKLPGFGSKREMIRGAFRGEVRSAEARDRRAAVIGAGLAGLTAAVSLLSRGWTVDLYERHEAPGREASGNPAGLFMPYLTAQPTPISRFTLRACETLLGALRVLGAGDLIQRTGIVRLADDDLESRIQKGIASHGLGRSWIRRVAPHKYLMRKAGWAQPRRLTEYLVKRLGELHADRFRFHALTELESLPDLPLVVLAAGADLARFKVSDWLPVRAVRGQLFIASPDVLTRLREKKRPAVFETYLIPFSEGLLVGATFEPFSSETERDPASDERLMARLLEEFPAIHQAILASTAEDSAIPAKDYIPPLGRVGFRPQTKDYVPIVGPLPGREAALELLHREQSKRPGDRAKDIEKELPLVSGVYVLGGGGSRGVMGSVLASEILAAWIEGEPFPVESDLVRSLLPHRFLLREAKGSRAKAR